ncbi:LuxR family transcriptional regulator [Paucimonas lemoignei]|uniref:LuxR family transcriptional regulator n=1 Tax=Paucimonas lemoignei TaxID=29443 RepID=A0A4R3I6H9_PAULE|nr:LuxR C-terminal-related transcriptional regulator [Paucimonas lemoignei]TCS39669.1 LuxR family transcriptional regulator [Paucimonas lemoignei]
MPTTRTASEKCMEDDCQQEVSSCNSPIFSGDLDKRILAVILESADVQNEVELTHLVNGTLRDVLPHEMLVCGIGGISPQGNFVRKFLQFNCPFECYEYYSEMLNAEGRVNSPLIQKWRERQEPVYFQSGRDDDQFPAEWVQLFNKYKMRNILGHGVVDLTGSQSSYFIFSRLAGSVGPEQAFLLKILTPHLHLALARAIANVQEYQAYVGKTGKPLSERQSEILYWMHEGKTNWEIAKILNLTELNVKYHIDQIFSKLDVRSRVNAVAKAHELGLVKPPKNQA